MNKNILLSVHGVGYMVKVFVYFSTLVRLVKTTVVAFYELHGDTRPYSRLKPPGSPGGISKVWSEQKHFIVSPCRPIPYTKFQENV